jgi:hypothetical protein
MRPRGNNLPLVIPIAASSYVRRQSKRERTILSSFVDWLSVRRYRVIIIVIIQEQGVGGHIVRNSPHRHQTEGSHPGGQLEDMGRIWDGIPDN